MTQKQTRTTRVLSNKQLHLLYQIHRVYIQTGIQRPARLQLPALPACQKPDGKRRSPKQWFRLDTKDEQWWVQLYETIGASVSKERTAFQDQAQQENGRTGHRQ